MKVSIKNTAYYYKDEGKGDLVLLIHGNPHSADYWEELMARILRPMLRY